MTQQGQNGNSDRWQPKPSVTQADRSMWQRQAAGTLCAIVGRHGSLPAIRWSVTRAGSLCGQVTGQPSPVATIGTFALWQEELQLEDDPGFSGASGTTHLRARADWGMVRITLAATAAPGKGAYEVPGAAAVAGQVTWHSYTAVHHLVRVLDTLADLDALTWAVLPSGGLDAGVGPQQSDNAKRRVFRDWESALGLAPDSAGTTGHVSRQVGFTQEGPVAIVVKATTFESPPDHARHRTVGRAWAGMKARLARQAAQASRQQQSPSAVGETLSRAMRTDRQDVRPPVQGQ